MYKILLIGTLPPPHHGQSIAFGAALDALCLDNKCKVVQTTFKSKSKFFSVVKLLNYLFLVPYRIFIFKPKFVYFLCSRSLVGGVRDLYLLFFCCMSKTFVVNHLHGADFTEYFESLPVFYRKIVKLLYRRVNKHIVLIDGMQEQLMCVARKEKITVVNNFYQESVEIDNNIGLERSGETLKVFFLSSVTTSKGIFELIEAIKKLNNLGVAIELTIAGGIVGDAYSDFYSTRDKFHMMIQSCSFISYIGVVDKDEKYYYLGINDVLILPSYFEAVPLCIIEGMRMGCCIITSNYKYLPSLVKENINGFLIESKSVEAIVGSLLNISKNRSLLLKITESNIKYAIKDFSESNYSSNILKIFEV